jgi:hypothetical protein
MNTLLSGTGTSIWLLTVMAALDDQPAVLLVGTIVQAGTEHKALSVFTEVST